MIASYAVTLYFKYSARFVPHLGKRKAVDGIWFLVLIAYVYTADTCLNLLRCVQVQVHEPVDSKGKRVSIRIDFVKLSNCLCRCTILMENLNVSKENIFHME